MRTKKLLITTTVAALVAAAHIVLVGCEGDSGETLLREVGLIVTGFYQHENHPESLLVGKNTGAPISQMDLRQNGDQLEGIDNNGILFKGTIGRADGENASFTLEGPTTAGEVGTIVGNINVAEGSTMAVMSGTWAEPSLFSTVAGVATVPSNSAPSVAMDDTNAVPLSISPDNPPSLDASLDGPVSFTASGGNPGSYQWDLAEGGLGSLNSTVGATVTYTANTNASAGTQTITVSDGDDSASASFNQVP